jgi:nitroimidazol reductase NimA-like FMN-containing flavoprotein (pyridoxamine 5'-phosphate oxidase superfamily)
VTSSGPTSDESADDAQRRVPDPPVGNAPASAQMSRAEAYSKLRAHPVGRLAFVVDGWPVVIPVNYAVDGDDVVFRTDRGTKLSACRSAQVTIQVDEIDRVYQSGWSVLVFGIADEIVAEHEIERLSSLPLRPWAKGGKAHWVRISTIEVTGRVLPRAWGYPSRVP